jgi:hypothetical protein
VPHKDPEQRRAYQREYRRTQRAGQTTTPAKADVPAEFRLKTAADALALVEQQLAAVVADPTLGTVERARCVYQGVSVALRAIEAGDLAARLEAIEAVMRSRRRPR